VILTANGYRKYVEPVIADMREEYINAVAADRTWQARWIAIRTWHWTQAHGLSFATTS
jgi:hypothetical protein